MSIKEGYTRVSTILGQWNHLAHIDKAVLSNKCRIGTEVHEKIAAETLGIYLEAGEDCSGYIKSWLAWNKELGDGVVCTETEKRMYCDDLKITGCVDAILDYGDKKVIVDYKTSASANKKMWNLQAAFYHYLALKSGYEVNENVTFLHLKKDGKKAREVVLNCNEQVWEVCKSALHTYRYFKG